MDREKTKGCNDNERRFQVLFEQSPLSVQVFSSDGRTIHVNRAWEELWGVTLDQIPEYNILEDEQLVASGIMPYIKKAFEGEAAEIPPILYDPNQTIPDVTSHADPRRWARAFIYPVKDDAGCVYEVVLMHEDITERKRAEENLKRWADVFEYAGWGVVLGNADGKTLGMMNKAYAQMHGYTVEELIGRPIIDVFAPESKAELPGHIRTTIELGHNVYECKHIRKDGTIFPALVESTAIKDSDGKLLHLATHVQDITERKRIEMALHEADRRALTEYERLLERVGTLGQALGTARELVSIFRALRGFATLSTSCDGIFISLYDQQQNMRTAVYAWSEGEEEDATQLPPMPMNESPQSRAVATGEVVITDDFQTAIAGQPVIHVGLDRNSHLPQSSLAVPMAVMGRIVGAVEVQSTRPAAFHPEHVTAMRMAANLAAVAIENVRLFEQESQARSLAEESSRLKDEFLATLSHELRTPLTSIYGWSRLLRSGKLDEKGVARAVEAIDRNSASQKKLIEDILDVSRIITGKLRLEVGPVSLVEIIEAAVDSIRPAADARQIQLDVVTSSRLGLITGDSNRLQQIVWNLLSNAIKFTPEGGRVEVGLRRVSNSIQLSVKDTGEGIATEFLPHVFDRFRQADQTITRTHGGLGLGLAIVRHLVELHGGIVTAESEGRGKGSTFIVNLPLASVDAEAREMLEEVRGISGIVSHVEYSPRLNDLRVLIVDDESDTLEFLSAVLGNCGATVIGVTSAADALRAIEETKPDLLISDIGMPDEDGYALIRKVRRLGGRRGEQIPAIALTAYAREEDRMRAFREGYQMHLAKPVDPTQLTTIVASFTGRSQIG